MSTIMGATIDQHGRLILDCDIDPGDSDVQVIVDGVVQAGTLVATPYGWLFRGTDGQWGLPGITWGAHNVQISWATSARGLSRILTVNAPHPASTLAGTQLTVANTIPVLYAAGFQTEDLLLAATGIAISESGLFTQARNWHPESGFRPANDIIGIQGPSLAWNQTHTQQGHSDRGLFQINSQAWPQYSDAMCDDPAQAAGVAFALCRNGTNFGIWMAYANGIAQSHYDQAESGWPALRPLVTEFLATK